MKKKWVLFLSCFLLGACSAPSKADQSEQTDALRFMSVSELTTLDTAALLDVPDVIAHTAVFEGLYTRNEQDELIPAVASAMPEISNEGKTYRIPLRKDAKWSNGDPVTAHDFVYAWRKTIDPKNGLIYSFLLRETLENAVAISDGKAPVDTLGVQAVDTHTLEIKLETAKSYFVSLLAFPTFFPQNQKVVEKYGDTYGSDSEKVVYNGPFVMEDWTQSAQKWTLVKNSHYWDQKNVRATQMQFDVVKETATAVNLFESGQLDMATITGEIAKQNQTHPDYHSYPTATMNYIRLNQKRKGKDTPLKNEDLRKALALGIDKENLVKNIIADGSTPLYGAITQGFVKNPVTQEEFRAEAGDLMTYDQKQALAYWKKAQAALGNEITLDLLVTDDGLYKQMAESLKGSLEELFSGLTISLRVLPTETALNLGRESDYDLFLIHWTPDYQDPISTLNTLYTGNDRNYSNPRYDQLLDEATNTYATDPEKRWQALIQAEKEVIEHTAGMIVLSQNQHTILKNDQVKGLTYHTFASPLTLKDIYKETD